MKYLIKFEKGESARWLGHLDILRTFERAIRRAELPITFTTGFNPRERIAFANALAVGITGDAEPATIELTASLPPQELLARLNDKLPPGIRIRSADVIPDAGSRDLLNSYVSALLHVVCDCDASVTLESAQAACAAFLARTSVMVEREREGKTRRIDIRPMVRRLTAETMVAGRLTLEMVLALGQDGSVRPAEVVDALADMTPGLSLRRAHRECLLTRDVESAGM